MKLLHMFNSGLWLETPAIQPEYAYVYWRSGHFEEHETRNKKYPKVPIGTNPFKKGN